MQRHPVLRRAPRVSGLMLLLAALAVGPSGPLAAQGTTRPQLLILQVETDPGLEVKRERVRFNGKYTGLCRKFAGRWTEPGVSPS